MILPLHEIVDFLRSTIWEIDFLNKTFRVGDRIYYALDFQLDGSRLTPLEADPDRILANVNGEIRIPLVFYEKIPIQELLSSPVFNSELCFLTFDEMMQFLSRTEKKGGLRDLKKEKFLSDGQPGPL
jgi:hypothetical protein